MFTIAVGAVARLEAERVDLSRRIERDDVLAELVRRGLIVEREGVYFGPKAVDAAARRVAELLVENPEGVGQDRFAQIHGETRRAGRVRSTRTRGRRWGRGRR